MYPTASVAAWPGRRKFPLHCLRGGRLSHMGEVKVTTSDHVLDNVCTHDHHTS